MTGERRKKKKGKDLGKSDDEESIYEYVSDNGKGNLKFSQLSWRYAVLSHNCIGDGLMGSGMGIGLDLRQRSPEFLTWER